MTVYFFQRWLGSQNDFDSGSLEPSCHSQSQNALAKMNTKMLSDKHFLLFGAMSFRKKSKPIGGTSSQTRKKNFDLTSSNASHSWIWISPCWSVFVTVIQWAIREWHETSFMSELLLYHRIRYILLSTNDCALTYL